MKKICYIDMDGVLADFEKSLYTLFPQLTHYAKGSDELKVQVDTLCATEGKRIFHDLVPMQGAVEAFNLLCEHYDVYMLSTPMWGVPESYMDKRIWIENVLGINAEKKLILSHNKGLLKGHYLIDDRLKHGVEDFEGEHIHFGQLGFENWIKVITYLREKDKW